MAGFAALSSTNGYSLPAAKGKRKGKARSRKSVVKTLNKAAGKTGRKK